MKILEMTFGIFEFNLIKVMQSDASWDVAIIKPCKGNCKILLPSHSMGTEDGRSI